MTTSDYIGKICPYCKASFKDGDDIVVCSVCEMPHHKECWIDNQGCTTFGCTGTIKSPGDVVSKETDFDIDLYDEKMTSDDQSSEKKEYLFCTRCGTQNPASGAFCFKCGSPMIKTPGQQQTPPKYTASVPDSHPYGYVQPGYYPGAESGGYNSQDRYQTFGFGNRTNIEMLIGKNTGYYIPKFNDMKARNTKSSWNWCAFLFAPYWMIYRKMYGYGAAVLGGAFLLGLTGSGFMSFVALIAYIVFGILGNYMYMQTLEKKASQMDMLTGQYKDEFANKNGGTDTAATVLTIIGYAILTAVIQLV